MMVAIPKRASQDDILLLCPLCLSLHRLRLDIITARGKTDAGAMLMIKINRESWP